MKPDPNCPITDEQLKKYESFIEEIKEPIENSKLPSLYCVLLQASFELDESKNFFTKSLLGKFTSKLLSKILNEGWAIMSCYERGAFLANYHHSRAALELIASYYWVTYKKQKIEKRIKKFFESDELFLYQLYLKYKDSQDDYVKQLISHFSTEQIELWDNKASDWIKLFEPEEGNLLKVSSWHYKTKIENILSEFPNKKLKMFYDEFSHATHLSPLSSLLGTRNTVLGFPIYSNSDLSEFNRPLTIYLEGFEILLSYIKSAIGYDSKVKFSRFE